MRDQAEVLALFASSILEANEPEALECLQAMSSPERLWIAAGNERFSLLAYAVMHGATTVVDALLEIHGVNLNAGIINTGHSPLMIACRNGSDDLLKKLIKAGASLSFRAADGQTVFTQIQRVSSFDILETAAREQDRLAELFHPQVLHNFCQQNLVDELSKHFVERLKAEKWRFARGFSLIATSLSENAEPNKKALGDSLQQMLGEMVAMRHETFAVLNDTDFCLRAFEALELQFKAFHKAEYFGSFPHLDRSTISIEKRGALAYPVPKDNYDPEKKHSALQRFLLGFLQARGILDLVHSLVYSNDIGIPRRHYSAIENTRVLGPFHGKFSRLLQAVLLVLAIEEGRARLPENLTLRQFIEEFFAEKAPATPQEQASFCDPYYLNSYMMNGGHQNAPSISDYMVASFCKQLEDVYERIYPDQNARPSLAAFCADTSMELTSADFVSSNPDQSQLFQGRKLYEGSRFFARQAERKSNPKVSCCVIS